MENSSLVTITLWFLRHFFCCFRMPSAEPPPPAAEPPKTELQELQLKAQGVTDDVSVTRPNP